MKQNTKEQERQEVPSQERDGKVKPIKETLAAVAVICSLVATWATVYNHQATLLGSIVIGVISVLALIGLYWHPWLPKERRAHAGTPPKQLTPSDAAQIPSRATPDTPKPDKIPADAQPESRVFERENDALGKEKALLKIAREDLLDEINQATEVKHEATPLPTSSPTSKSTTTTPDDRLGAPLVRIERIPETNETEDGPCIRLSYVYAGRSEQWDFPHEQQAFDVPPVVAEEAIRLGYFRKVKPVSSSTPEPTKPEPAEPVQKQVTPQERPPLSAPPRVEEPYCRLDDNYLLKTHTVEIKPKGKAVAKQQRSPFPIRDFDQLPPWPPEASKNTASKMFQGPPPWTHYTIDNTFGHRLIWRWRYNAEMNDGYPENPIPYCPQCNTALAGTISLDAKLPRGAFVTRLQCARHMRAAHDIVGDENGEYSSIARLIILNIRDGGWIIAVRRQGGYPPLF